MIVSFMNSESISYAGLYDDLEEFVASTRHFVKILSIADDSNRREE